MSATKEPTKKPSYHAVRAGEISYRVVIAPFPSRNFIKLGGWEKYGRCRSRFCPPADFVPHGFNQLADIFSLRKNCPAYTQGFMKERAEIKEVSICELEAQCMCM